MITGKTAIVGIIGDPVEHSLSPPMHNAAFKELKLDYVYIPFHVTSENLAEAVHGARAMGIKGLNITIPHKREIIKYIDELDEAAELIGAVNTVKFNEERTVGYNTDGLGAIRAIEEIEPVKNKKVVILGAGGAARAISFQILLSGAGEVVIANRTVDNACNLVKDIKNRFNFTLGCCGLDDKLKNHLKDSDILINTTPIGMHPHEDQEPLVSCDMMHSNLVVNDIVYNPLKTGLLKEAEKAGAKIVFGTKMLIYQGVEAFRIWTGVKPPANIFEKALLGVLGH